VGHTKPICTDLKRKVGSLPPRGKEQAKEPLKDSVYSKKLQGKHFEVIKATSNTQTHCRLSVIEHVCSLHSPIHFLVAQPFNRPPSLCSIGRSPFGMWDRAPAEETGHSVAVCLWNMSQGGPSTTLKRPLARKGSLRGGRGRPPCV